MLRIIEKTKIWFIASFLLIVIGIGFIAVRGLNFGIDFKGGTEIVIDMGKEFNKAEVDDVIKKYSPEAITNTVETTQLAIKANNLDAGKVSELVKELSDKYKLGDKALVSQNEIGASVGKELSKNSLIALGIAVLGMLIYVGFRFELNFGIAAILALLHDVLMTISIYAIFNVPVNSPFIAAILTIIGYSINDTIVIFDRIRENNKKMRRADSVEIANKSVTETMARSINTTLTTLITITAVYFFVPTVREFAFPLIIGIVSGAYSSIFIASPIWVMLKKRKAKLV
ncbi:protein-export membrane protein SecF [Clostridium polyendosporum]|uniref:Protein-export membrane protein SecF n=1 Tax=Clostridium polyendosporum TaxID=69208 RepID=A0A919RZG5_9CLOT|nr:protein translocase subunit SecF [Clostridium polyendosporum]GIM28639.1 protein-export membrane protein SecF [Clostridium polyendosporum]